MKMISVAALAVGMGLLSASASAAPASTLNGLQAALPNASNVETVQYGPRRCWRRYDGALVCRRAFRRYGYYDDRYYDPYYGRGYGYYGPGSGIGLYFGGGRHRHW